MLNHKLKNITISLLLFTVVLSATACGNKKEDLVSKDLVSSEDGYGTETAKIGQLKGTKSFSGSVVYPVSATIYSQYNGVVMEKIEVEAGDKVKAGDLLVSIKPVTDETIAEQEAAIEKNREELNTGISNYKSQIASLENSIASSSGTQQQIYQVQKEKTERQLEYYEDDGERVQQDMKEELEILKTLKGDLNIYASYDGVIDSVQNVPEGTELTTSRELLTMHSESETFIYVSEGSSLKYNMSVQVEAGVGENRVIYEGKVVSANNVLDDAYQNGSATIKLNEKVPADLLKNITVKADLKKLNNVLLVKNYAVSTQNDKKYVTIVDGEKLMKRPVIVGTDDGEYMWIVKGLEDGQNVLIQ